MQTLRYNDPNPAATEHAGAGQVRTLHTVLVADGSGMPDAFILILNSLGREDNDLLTLVYCVAGLHPKPLFHSELQILEKRFPTRFLACYASDDHSVCPDGGEAHQQILEIILNSNTSEVIHFVLAGRREMTEKVSERLRFLGIHSEQIHIQLLKN